MENVEFLCRIYWAFALLGYPIYMFKCYKKHGFKGGMFNDKLVESILYLLWTLFAFSAVFFILSIVSFVIFGDLSTCHSP